jgi:MraZ protein
MRDRRLAELVRGNLSMQLVNLDGQSRILLPKKLLQIAGLENEILWIPARGKTLALWKPETFNAKIRQNTIDADAMFDSVFYGSGLTEGSNGNA